MCAPQTVDVLGMVLSQQVTCPINRDETGDLSSSLAPPYRRLSTTAPTASQNMWRRIRCHFSARRSCSVLEECFWPDSANRWLLSYARSHKARIRWRLPAIRNWISGVRQDFYTRRCHVMRIVSIIGSPVSMKRAKPWMNPPRTFCLLKRMIAIVPVAGAGRRRSLRAAAGWVRRSCWR